MGLFAYWSVCINTNAFRALLPLHGTKHNLTFELNINENPMLDVLLKEPEGKPDSKGIIKVSERVDKPIKSIMKSVSWRIVGTIDTMIISYFITGRVTIAISIGSVEVITKTILYYFHERLWAHIHKIKLNLLPKPDGKKFEIKRAEQTACR
jgi:uncharacterized membrane protein